MCIIIVQLTGRSGDLFSSARPRDIRTESARMLLPSEKKGIQGNVVPNIECVMILESCKEFQRYR
jgi:hypothetical protein